MTAWSGEGGAGLAPEGLCAALQVLDSAAERMMSTVAFTTVVRSHRLTAKSRVRPPVPRLAPHRRPEVSVIIPCFNYGQYLPQSIGSALAQEGVQCQIIVVDDASTDNSVEVAERYASQNEAVQIVRHNRNTGHVLAFNDGLEKATGEFIVRLDADDLLTPGSLARAAALFDAFPTVGLVYGHPRHFTTEIPPAARTALHGWSVWAGDEWVADRCRKGVNCITTPEAVIRASTLRFIGGLNPALRFAQDMEMWLRTAAVSDVGRIDGADQALHRDHADSMSATTGSGKLTDLRERALVFEVLFAGTGGRMNEASGLHWTACRALAAEALTHACSLYDRGRTKSDRVDDYVDFAIDAFPEARTLPQWRALRWRIAVGVRFAPVTPMFVASAVRRRLEANLGYRRWQRTGL
jgi:Glycosyl transferase family 2